jgi:2-polyprenyl-3-methyl-5-hydroxy-6-metoxy-1,4-benzoquinol methylase
MDIRVDPEQNEQAALMRIGANFDAARVLEVGCGKGRLTRTFAARARSVVAIDPDQRSIADFLSVVWPRHVEALAVGLEAFDPARHRFDLILFSWSL